MKVNLKEKKLKYWMKKLDGYTWRNLNADKILFGN